MPNPRTCHAFVLLPFISPRKLLSLSASSWPSLPPSSASMGSEVAVVGELPQLPPLEMTAVDADHEECVTPRSEEPVLVCPPAPRKPRTAKRTSPESPPPREFFPVPRDLASVFLPLPPTKRIRVV
nr:PREDICTED: uncharacterized protein LOC103983960 [Musa acuminata subsp. malaccensis]